MNSEDTVPELALYELRNLVAHLEAAGQEDTLHQLFSLETDAGTNYWFEAKDYGDAGGYAADAQRALRLVRRAVDAHILAGEPAPEIALEIRYALLIASVRTAAGQIPTTLLTAMVDKGVRSAEEVLAYLTQTQGGRLEPDVIASLAPYLPDRVRHEQLKRALLDLGSLDDFQRGEALSALAPHLTSDLLGDALHAARTITTESVRAEALSTVGPRLPPELRDEGVAAASEIQEPSLRIAALVGLGIPTSSGSLRAALAKNAETKGPDRDRALILLASSLPPELLGEVLVAASNSSSYTTDVVTALAPRLPDDLVPKALRIVPKIDRYHHPGRAMAVLAPRLSGRALQAACRRAASFRESEDRIQALNELALRHSKAARDRILRRSLQAAEGATYGSPEMKDAVVRLVELLPQQLLPRALTLARRIDPNKGGTAVLVAVGARLSGRDRETVLRKALEDTRRIDDDELAWTPGMMSATVLAKLAVLLPGEVLPFVLDDVRPDETGYWTSTTWRGWTLARLSAIAPHLEASELRDAQRAVRELEDGPDQCEAIAGLAGFVEEPARSELLRASLDGCRRIRRRDDQGRALRILAPKLSEDLGAEALDVAESIKYEAGARARARVACSVPPRLLSRAIAVAPGYEGWRAVAVAAMAQKVEEPTKTELFQQALAVVGITDWDDTLAQGVGFITELAPHLPKQLLDEAVDRAMHAATHSTDDRSSALTALARRFDGAERAAVLEQALIAAQSIHWESTRVRALVDLGAEVLGVIEAIRQLDDAKWRAFGLAHLGEPVDDEALRAPIGDLSDLDSVDATLSLLPFAPPDHVRAVLAELRDGDKSLYLFEGEFLPDLLAALAPRLGVEFLPDLSEVAAAMPPSTRLPLVTALATAFPSLSPRQLHDCWVQARAALDDVGRSKVLSALATLAPIVDAIGGRTGVQETAIAVHHVAHWHP